MSNEVKNDAEDSVNNEPSVVDNKEETSAQASADETSTEHQGSNEEDFGAILEKFEQEQTTYHAGEIVVGKVIGVSEHGVVIDFGYKSEGIVPIEEFTSPGGEVAVKEGDDVEVIIKTIHTGDAPPVLSRSDALRRRSWDKLERAYNQGTPVQGRVIDKTKGGLRVDIEGVEAFLPGSQVESRPVFNLDPYRGQEIEAKIIKFSRKRNNIVLSRKVLVDEVINKQKSETLSRIEQSFIVEGTIKNLTEYGAFVDIGGIDGLLHVTDMSWGRLQNPADLFKVGEQIQVKVLKLDREKEKVSLGYKQLLPDPWSSVTEIYPVGARIKGRVSSVTEYGAFVELEPGVEGLVHVSEMSWSKRAKSPKQIVKPSDEVEVQVLGVDTEERRISLGMRQLLPNPWETIAAKYRVGSTVSGKVRNLTDFGAFIEIEEGVDGLVHVSDISWSKKIKHPKDVLKKGQEVQAVVTNIDPDAQRLSLSIKELQPSAWDSFVANHRPGDIVRGKISRFAGFGVFVELAEDLEGLCHISELSDERIEHPEKVFDVGQELDFKILRIEHDNQKIGLSHRAVGKEEEPAVDVKSYTTEAKGGMASLAELANLKFTPKEQPKEEPKKEEAAQPAEPEAPAQETPYAEENRDILETAGAVEERTGEDEAPQILAGADESAAEALEAPAEEASQPAAEAAEPATEPAEATAAGEDAETAAPGETDDTAAAAGESDDTGAAAVGESADTAAAAGEGAETGIAATAEAPETPAAEDQAAGEAGGEEEQSANG